VANTALMHIALLEEVIGGIRSCSACTHGHTELRSSSTEPRFHGIPWHAEDSTGLINRPFTYIAEHYSRPQWSGKARDMVHQSASGLPRRAGLFGIGSLGRKMLEPFAVFFRIGLIRGNCGSTLFSPNNGEGFVNDDSYQPTAEGALTLDR